MLLGMHTPQYFCPCRLHVQIFVTRLACVQNCNVSAHLDNVALLMVQLAHDTRVAAGDLNAGLVTLNLS